MLPTSVLVKNQKQVYAWREFKDERGNLYRINATVRHDDECGNGHNSFSITGEIQEFRNRWREHSCGCIHDSIAKHFPELAPFIKWHLTSTDGPMHYIANTLYHASDRDYRGLLKGEKRQLRNGKTNKPVWQRVMRDGKGEIVGDGSSSWVGADERPTEQLTAAWEPVWIEGEGKARALAYARSSAVWPDATDEQLTAPPEELKAALLARLPALMAEFKAAVESLGFVY